jgi:fermentation-respiration switch protein FrsA (DUF1100 family)
VFEYFPGNYVWNLAVVAALNSGGLIDEVDRACRPIREAAARGEDAGTKDFLAAWTDLTDQLEELAGDAAATGHSRTAGELYFRATNYLCNAERMQSASSPGRLEVYRRVLRLAQQAMEHRDPQVTRVAVPYEDTALPAYYSQAAAAAGGGTAPVIILWNGLDSTKEHMYTSSHWAELSARGISCLMIDCPGSGEAWRLQGLTARVDSEAWAAACVDYLLTRPDVDPARIGLTGWSLGGYYAPRAAAFEKRLALVVAWGANHNWGAVQRRRLEREGERPVPHYWEHVLWVWGQPDLGTFIKFARRGSSGRRGIADQRAVPHLPRRNDRQIPLENAHRSYDQATSSPRRELRIFTAAEGGAEHIGLDDLPYVSSYVADWVSDVFGSQPESAPSAAE